MISKKYVLSVMRGSYECDSYHPIDPAPHGGTGFPEQCGVFHGLYHLTEVRSGSRAYHARLLLTASRRKF